MSKRVKVLIVDDSAVIRQLLSMLLCIASLLVVMLERTTS